MARNTSRYKYVMIGIPVGEILEDLQEEAATMHLKLPTFLTTLLIDRYTALHSEGRQVWFPRGGQHVISKQIPTTSEDGLLAKASAASSVWGGLDDE